MFVFGFGVFSFVFSEFLQMFNILDHVIYGDTFLSSFPVGVTIISFSGLMAHKKTSRTMLSISDKNRHLTGDAFSLSSLCVMLAVVYSEKQTLVKKNCLLWPVWLVPLS